MNNNSLEKREKIEGIRPLLDEAIAWGNTFLKSQKKKDNYLTLSSVRRKLKKIHYALSQNPSAALYGESQVGKSYLIKNMLSKKGENLQILDPDSGISYDFLEDINPGGEGVEATSVVTRFSSTIKIANKKYPILIRLLSAKDLALILIDSSFSELSDSLKYLKKDDISSKLQIIKEEYDNKPKIQSWFSEDDIHDIKDYIKEYFPSSIAFNNLKDAEFWDIAPHIVEKMPPEKWYTLLGLIWSNNEHINKLFKQLVNALKKLDFSKTVYCEFVAILRDYGTLLNVNRLNQVQTTDTELQTDANKEYRSTVELLLPEHFETIRNIDKGLLCALVAELVFKVDKSIEKEKPFLSHIDLVDFPGARSRVEVRASKVAENIPSMLLRGKVAYIFNKYSEEYLISNLLLCNNSKQIEVAYIPRLLNNWIDKYIGDTPDMREVFLNKAITPPLFIIYTWFNTDLVYNSVNNKDRKSLDEKWEKRFIRIFEQQLVTKNYDWDKHWTTTQPYFQNMYMLRDFIHSDTSGLFDGYAENQVEKKQCSNPKAYKGNYWADLKASFVNFDFVKKHFKNPNRAWEDSATLNNDGTQPIIDALTLAANSKINEHKINSELQKVFKIFQDELNKHYHDDNSDGVILKAIQKAKTVKRELATFFTKSPFFFGKFIDRLLIREVDIFKYYHSKISDIETVEQGVFDIYTQIWLENPALDINASFEENVAVLQKAYGFESMEQTVQYYEEHKVDLNELFYGDANLLRSNSEILADGLLNYWFEEYLNEKRFEQFIDGGFSSEAINDLLDNMKTNVAKVQLSKIIAKSIRKYVDRYDKIDKIQEMIADISAAYINKFVNTMGNDFYSKTEIQSISKTNDENNLDLNIDSSQVAYKSMNEQELETFFGVLENLNSILKDKSSFNKETIKDIPAFHNYFQWRDLMMISFVATCDIPTYDIMANNELASIIQNVASVTTATPHG